ncbi:hypothetical protein HNR46_004166 [Haloferula luteola]|uniref:Uncharacterized protein n=1 Tax=Haloferula luteola TaxID=595692 RepID=A0A840VMQ3_9BACT|nr:hypothetical protein [Haloferula luteola]MBB5353901.1 hypothetical protein [Haloferula luteola]
MIASVKDWIESTLLEQDRIAFEKIGPQRLIFKIAHRAPLVSLFLDPPPVASVDWVRCGGGPLTDSLFERLSPVVSPRQCTWFFVSMPQDEYTVLKWVAPLNMATWNSSRLYAFENAGSEGGAQSLCLAIGTESLLVFTLKDGFEIAYYGPDGLWEEIVSALYTHGSR